MNLFISSLSIPENASEKDKQDFMNELNILKKVGYHRNVVCLVGACHIHGKSVSHLICKRIWIYNHLINVL